MLTRRGLARLICGATALATTGFSKIAEALVPKPASNALQAINQRRLLLHVRQEIDEAVECNLFEPLDLIGHNRIRYAIQKTLADLVSRGLLKTSSAELDLRSYTIYVRYSTNYQPSLDGYATVGPFTSEPWAGDATQQTSPA
jgi:hypothetical protein